MTEEILVTPGGNDILPKNKNIKKIFILAMAAVFVLAGVFYLGTQYTALGDKYNLYNLFHKKVSYTKNPARRSVPLEAVVKISVGEGDREAFGSGLLFTKDGYIITNAHVVSTELGKQVKNMKVCFTSPDGQETKCTAQAKLVDANRYEDLALIKISDDFDNGKFYPLVVKEDDETDIKKLLPLGESITAVGYPGVGGNTITLTKGVVSGYQTGEIYFDNGSLEHIPFYLKTDTEINHGNSGGAVFDKDNRYIGVATLYHKDVGGKISSVIYWNKVNLYLHGLMQQKLLSLPSSQFEKRKNNGGKNLWEGIDNYFAGEYDQAIQILEKVVQKDSGESRAWHYLCASYYKKGRYDDLFSCAKSLYESNPDAGVLATLYRARAHYFLNKSKEYYENLGQYYITNGSEAALEEIANFETENGETNSVDLSLFSAWMHINLKEYEIAELVLKEVSKLDPENADVPYYRGLIAKNKYQWERAVEYFEDSFYLRPEADVALLLGDTYFDLYDESLYKDDLVKSILYTLSSAIMEPGNLSTLSKLAGNIAEYVDIDTKNTWGTTVKTLQDKFDAWGLDSEMISAISDLSDEDIIYSWKYDFKNKNEPTADEITASRQEADMTAAWFATFVKKDGQCAEKFEKTKQMPLEAGLRKLKYSDKSVAVVLKRHATLECLCLLPSPTNDEMTKCIDDKMKKL